jgi:hypothetical protein
MPATIAATKTAAMGTPTTSAATSAARRTGLTLPLLHRGAVAMAAVVGTGSGPSVPRSHRRPARLSTLAGTPTSRNAAALLPLRFAHEAATFTNASSSSPSRSA